MKRAALIFARSLPGRAGLGPGAEDRHGGEPDSLDSDTITTLSGTYTNVGEFKVRAGTTASCDRTGGCISTRPQSPYRESLAPTGAVIAGGAYGDTGVTGSAGGPGFGPSAREAGGGPARAEAGGYGNADGDAAGAAATGTRGGGAPAEPNIIPPLPSPSRFRRTTSSTVPAAAEAAAGILPPPAPAGPAAALFTLRQIM